MKQAIGQWIKMQGINKLVVKSCKKTRVKNDRKTTQ
jgi:hypothetical protein